MPDEIATARQRVAGIQQQLVEKRAAQEALNQRMAELANEEERWARDKQSQEHALDGLERQMAKVDQELQWQRELLEQKARSIDESDNLANKLARETTELEQQEQQAQDAVQSLTAKLAELDTGKLQGAVAQAEKSLAVTEGHLESQQRVLKELKNDAAQMMSQTQDKQARLERLGQEIANTGAAQRTDLAQAETLTTEFAQKDDEIKAIEDAVTSLRQNQRKWEDEETRKRKQVRQIEHAYNQAKLEEQRASSEVQNLKKKIENDLGLVEGVDDQHLLPLEDLVSNLPTVEALPEGLDDQVKRLKRRLRRMGAINPNAPAEYEEAQARYTFLTSQSEDLRQAAQSLREVIAELDDAMNKQFMDTFKEVAREFTEYFKLLFGGGTAKLVLGDPENVSESGIDIIAQPPGKRRLPLPLLSGGERSLTAIALLFAILKVRPTPFCVLDEVDAMLDEANIVRFRDALCDLSTEIQFIIITHSRPTIEIAQAIYGISLGEDQTSRAISVDLSEADEYAARNN